MKQLSCLLLGLLILPSISWATWQVAGQIEHKVTQGGQQSTKIVNSTPKIYRVNPDVTLKTHKGSLINNVTSYAHKRDWQVLWLARRNYPIHLATTIQGPNMPIVLHRLLRYYPLKVHFAHNQKLIIIAPLQMAHSG